MATANVGGNAGAQLKSYIERVEKLKEEIAALNEDVSEVYKEAKHSGYVVKAMKEIIKIRSTDKDELDEHEAIVHVYKVALGMVPGDGA